MHEAGPPLLAGPASIGAAIGCFEIYGIETFPLLVIPVEAPP